VKLYLPFWVFLLAAVSVAPAESIVIERDAMIPTRDGVQLATDVYRPNAPGRFTVLLHRTPYDKGNDELTSQAVFFAENGYVVAVQDLRGRYGSGGVFQKYNDLDAFDGYDTIEWLARQPYADGKVAMWGTSYAAHAQAVAAQTNPPSLAALILNQGGMANAWDHAVRHGGAFELGRELTWAFRYAAAEATDPVVKKAFELENVEDWLLAFPIRRGLSPLALAPEFEAYFLEELARSDYDEFWTGRGLNWSERYEETADVPMLHVGGWFDIFLRGTIRNYENLHRLKSSPIRLLVGPWGHSGNDRTFAGDVDFGPDSAIHDFDREFHLRWFDRVLRGRPSGGPSDSEVRLFVMGTGDGGKDEKGRLRHGGYWLDSDAWPPSGTSLAKFYFHAEGGLRPDPPDMDRSSTTYEYDPRHPVPTLGGSVSSRLKDGAFDQRERPDFLGSRPPYLPLKARSDVLVFQTEPLSEEVTVIGPIEVRLFVSSSAVDTDFTAKLVDVYPPSEDFPEGFEMNLTDALVRMSYRGGRTSRALVEPGEVYEIAVHPFPTANVFKKGHRIRLDVSSSNFPRFDVNPNTGEPAGKGRRFIEAANAVHHDRERPSHVVLPLLRSTSPQSNE
jgi:putative CocE/NonD family hydrolase